MPPSERGQQADAHLAYARRRLTPAGSSNSSTGTGLDIGDLRMVPPERLSGFDDGNE